MITFTEEAKTKVLQFIESSEEEDVALRISIASRSKKGFKYNFQLEGCSGERADDVVLQEGGFSTRIDPESAKWLKSAKIQWKDTDGGAFSVDNPNSPIPSSGSEALEEEIVDAIKTIFDPEIPKVNIYDLGLIYNVHVENTHAKVQMTLTAPNCPASEQLHAEVEQKTKGVPGIETVEIDLTFEPPWTPERMSEEAKLILNMM